MKKPKKLHKNPTVKKSMKQLGLKGRMIISVILIALIGLATLLFAQAATNSVSIETESGTTSSPARIVTDSTASKGSSVEFGIASTGTIQPPIPAATGKTWRPILNEDFNSTTVDLNKWSPCFSWADSYEACSFSFNNGRESYKPSQVRISNGIASLVAEPQARDGNGKTYKSGLITTSNKPGSSTSLFKYKYGYAEARMKLPSQRGFFSAWWLMPPDYGRWSYAYEVDVLEALGGGDRIANQTVHHTNRTISWNTNGNGGNGKCPTFDYSQDFHTYGFDWQPTYIAMYIDGKECGKFTGPVWAGEMELIINLMIDVDWQRNVGLGMTNATLTGQMDIDYVKVWQQQ